MIADYWKILKCKLCKAHKSWTVWFNMLVSLIAFLADNISVLKEYLPSNLAWIIGIIAIVNLFLRFKTVNDLAHK